MLKLKTAALFLGVILLLPQGAQAAELTTGQKAARIPALITRGIFDFFSAPGEFIRTPMVEKQEHPRLWPLTSVPRTATNIFYRLGSAIYDAAFYPFAAPFVDETPPLTEKLGIAGDIWEMEDEH